MDPRTRLGHVGRNRLMVHPAAAKVVLDVLRAPPDRARDISKVVMTDPALSAAVLRSANSVHLGNSRRIAGIRQATVLLGGSFVESLAAGRVADLVLDASPPDYPDWLWLHSLAMGCTCSVLADHAGASRDEAFTAGLLHDVGWLLAASNGVDLAATASDHATVGAELLARWNLPDRIVAAAQHHHGRSRALSSPLEILVASAHAFSAALGAPSPERSISLADAIVLLGLTDVRPQTILDRIETELAVLTADLVATR